MARSIPETPIRFGDALSAVIADKTLPEDRIHEPLPVRTVRRFGGQPRGHPDEFIPAVFKAPLSRHVRVNEPRVFLRVMREQAERRILVEPPGHIRAGQVTVGQQRLSHNLPVADGQQFTEPDFAR